MNSELMAAIIQLEKEKGISKDDLFDAIEASLMTASLKHFGKADNVKVVIDRETGKYELFQLLEVVRDEDFEDPQTQITKDDLKDKYGEKLKLGDVYQRKFESADFGRIASQNAKSVILQKIREAERRSVYDQFYTKEHEVATGTIRRKTGRNLAIDLGKADAILTENEMVPTENYMTGSRIKVYIVEVKDSTKGPRILASRKRGELVKKLFELEVPEIQNGTVEIMSIAREAGSRTKIAVWSNDADVDPISACVGKNGSRVEAVVNELYGEKIDIINWSDQSAELIENALSPAKVICVLADDEEKSAIVIVPDYQLSLAIGKLGQNARLAAKLTGYKIDIKCESKAREEGIFEEIGYVEDYFEGEEEETEEYGEEYYDDEDYSEGYSYDPEEDEESEDDENEVEEDDEQ